MTAEALTQSSIDWSQVRAQFPVLDQEVHGKPLVYLDNAASSHVPQCTIDAIRDYLMHDHSNVHRGVHALSQRATDAFDATRELVRAHINASSIQECVFTKGATEAMNLVARSYGQAFIGEGDEIIVSTLEHHSNIVPWQLLCERTGALLRVIPMHDDGTLDFDAFTEMLGPKTKMVGLIHVSNALGTINPIKKYIDAAHNVGAKVLIDGCQATPHMVIDVQDLDVDFYAFSAHKTYGPTGLGVLYGKRELLDAMPPFLGGGDMIKTVSFDKTEYADLPFKFEAGTPPIMNVVGFGATLRFIKDIGLDAIADREHQLLQYATEAVLAVDGVRIMGPADLSKKTAVLSLDIENAHPHDVGTILDAAGVAIRAGHHCAQPVMDRLGIAATARASFAFYNTESEVDRLVAALHDVKEIFG